MCSSRARRDKLSAPAICISDCNLVWRSPMRRLLFTFTFVVSALPLLGCGKSGSQAPRINAGGATFVDPIMQKWSGEYKTAKNVEIDYVAKGSGVGISGVTSKTIDFGCSDAPM